MLLRLYGPLEAKDHRVQPQGTGGNGEQLGADRSRKGWFMILRLYGPLEPWVQQDLATRGDRTGAMSRLVLALAFALLASVYGAVQAQTTGFEVLQGRWVRPDGGYTISIKSVDANGRLDAAYANPNPLPFAIAEATRDGETIKIFLELRAGGYNGSTYALTYDPISDTLKGVYFQAVAQQKFDVYFARAEE
jgi:hypothetical protein